MQNHSFSSTSDEDNIGVQNYSFSSASDEDNVGVQNHSFSSMSDHDNVGVQNCSFSFEPCIPLTLALQMMEVFKIDICYMHPLLQIDIATLDSINYDRHGKTH